MSGSERSVSITPTQARRSLDRFEQHQPPAPPARPDPAAASTRPTSFRSNASWRVSDHAVGQFEMIEVRMEPAPYFLRIVAAARKRPSSPVVSSP